MKMTSYIFTLCAQLKCWTEPEMAEPTPCSSFRFPLEFPNPSIPFPRCLVAGVRNDIFLCFPFSFYNPGPLTTYVSTLPEGCTTSLTLQTMTVIRISVGRVTCDFLQTSPSNHKRYYSDDRTAKENEMGKKKFKENMLHGGLKLASLMSWVKDVSDILYEIYIQILSKLMTSEWRIYNSDEGILRFISNRAGALRGISIADKI